MLAHARRHPVDPASSQGGRPERGAIIIEMAIVATLLITLIAGTFDYGQAWRAALAANEGVRGGARVASGVGKATSADVSIITSLQSTMASNGQFYRVDRVVIFKANDTGGRPSNECINGSGGLCNTFTGEQFRNVTSGSTINGSGCITAATRLGWCPTARDDVQQTADYVGVWVRTSYKFMFPFFGNTQTIERSAVMRIEP